VENKEELGRSRRRWGEEEEGCGGGQRSRKREFKISVS
jgi:hypothetical protein